MTHSEQHMTGVGYWQALNRKSLLRFFLFAALAKNPMHGYELADAVAVCCDGVRPTDAMIYPTLKELEANSYISCRAESTGARTRNICTLTQKGMDAYRAAAQAWSQAMPQIESAVHSAGVTACCTDRKRVQGISFEEIAR